MGRKGYLHRTGDIIQRRWVTLESLMMIQSLGIWVYRHRVRVLCSMGGGAGDNTDCTDWVVWETLVMLQG